MVRRLLKGMAGAACAADYAAMECSASAMSLVFRPFHAGAGGSLHRGLLAPWDGGRQSCATFVWHRNALTPREASYGPRSALLCTPHAQPTYGTWHRHFPTSLIC